MNTHLIYNLDVLDGFKKIHNNSIDLLVTSPPYNCGIDYDCWNDSLNYQDYLNWCEAWLIEMRRVLKPDGRFAINVLLEMGICNNEQRVSPQSDFYALFKKLNLNLLGQAIWSDFNRSTLTAWGSWLSASSPYIYNPYEVILMGYKQEKKKSTKGISTISKEDFLMGVSGIWKIKPETQGLTKVCFPVELPKLAIELLTYENDTVLDPFMGSGTTAIACIMTHRSFIGFELSSAYCKIAEQRIQYARHGISDVHAKAALLKNKEGAFLPI